MTQISVPRIALPRITLGIIALFSLLLAQCSFGGAEPTPTPVELQWTTWQQNSAVELELIKRYRADHPEVTFRRQGSGLGETTLDSEPVPDILNVLVNYDLLRWAKEGKLADLTELWRDTGLESAIPQSFQQLTEREAKQYVLPAAFDYTGVFYNKGLFEQYQLQPPQNWDDLVQLCDNLLINGEVPFALSGNGITTRIWFDMLLLRVGGREFYQSLIDGKLSYEDARVQEAIQRWQVLIDQGCFVENPSLYDDQRALQMLVRSDNGMLGRTKAAMMLVDAFTFTQMPQKFREEMDFFPFPQISPDVPLTELVAITGYVLPAGAANSAAALDYFKFMSSKESQTVFTQDTFVSSALLAPVRSDIDPESMTPDMQQAVKNVGNSESVAPLSFTWMPTEMIARTELAFRKLTTNDWDFVGFVQILEEARQSALESGLLSEEN